MADNIKGKFNALSERLKVGGAEVGRKMSVGMSSMSFKMKGIFQAPTQADKSLKARGVRFPARDNESLAPIFTPPEAVTRQPTITNVAGHPNQSLAQMLNFHDRLVPQSNNLSQEQIKEVFDVARNSINLLSTVLTSSPQGEAMKDELTSALVEQCKQSQTTLQRIIESVGDSESLLFEALNVNDEIQHILSNFEEIPSKSAQSSAPALIPIHVEEEDLLGMEHEDTLFRNHTLRPLSNARPASDEEAALADLDEMIFGKKARSPRQQSSKTHKSDDLIAF